MLEHALDSIDSYVAFFTAQPLPVLKRTAKELGQLQTQEGEVTARRLSQVVLNDPLMTLKVLTFLEQHRRQSQNHDITTIERAIMMLGIQPFFRLFSDLILLEDQLREHPKAMVGVLKVIGRAKRASLLARDWAGLRHDQDIEEVIVATLLHEITEILSWCFAPRLTQRVYDMQLADRSLRSVQAQREVFGFAVRDMQHALVKAFHLPQLLISLLDEEQAESPRVRTVTLAINTARHSTHGWDNPALPDDMHAVCSLLRVRPEFILSRLDVPPESALWAITEPPPADPVQGA